MKKTVGLLGIVLFITLLSCRDNKIAKSNEFIVKGELQNAFEQVLYLQELKEDKLITIDSIILGKKGEFLFRYKPADVNFYLLKTKSPNNFVTLLMNKGETLEIKGDYEKLANSYSLEGSEGSMLIKELNNHTQYSYTRLDSLRKIWEEKKDATDNLQLKNTLDSLSLKIFNDERNFVQGFVKDHSNSLVSIIALYLRFAQSPIFSEITDAPLFILIDSALFKTYPTNKQVIAFHERVATIKQREKEKKMQASLEVGSVAPDIILNSPDGKPVSLSSLRGKYVLLDFWASWCAPCRQENPNLVAIYKKFKNKGFEIYGVSFDKDKRSWVNGINQDHITWIQVSDLMFWNSPIAKLYNVEGIPFSYLLDKEGKIIAKGLRGKELEEKISSLFK